MGPGSVGTCRPSGTSAWGHLSITFAIRMMSSSLQQTSGRAIGALVVLLVAVLFVYWGRVGYIGSDDVYWYYAGARGWLDHFPFVGGHGTIRYKLNVPMALTVAALGPGIVAVALASLIYSAAMVAIAYVWLARSPGTPVAIVAAIAVATMPLFAVQVSIASIDFVEVCFVLGAVVLLVARQRREVQATFLTTLLKRSALGPGLCVTRDHCFRDGRRGRHVPVRVRHPATLVFRGRRWIPDLLGAGVALPLGDDRRPAVPRQYRAQPRPQSEPRCPPRR